jgi:NADH:ubiquinone oxidoreductase subunit F (NADH-binding)
LDLWGRLDVTRIPFDVLQELEDSGLVGHGGAWFPVAKKWRAVTDASRRRPVVVANGAEGEPMSRKDELLLTIAPHLLLDGLCLAAHTLNAERAVAYVPASAINRVRTAVNERQRQGLDPIRIDIAEAPDTFIAGQESAVVNALSGGRAALPSFVGLRSIRERGVNGRPTLVQNVETLAHAALIARFGADWFRTQGTTEFPGSMLLTVTGRWEQQRVVEVPIGSSFRDVLALDAVDPATYRGALLGGYGGGWVSLPELSSLSLIEPTVRAAGSSLGAGVVALLPRSVCPLAELARVVRYMEGQGARQCGPCVNGLAGLANAMDGLAFGARRKGDVVKRILTMCGYVEGRGACRHPDGVARFVRTGISLFSDEVSKHVARGPCSIAHQPGYLAVGRQIDRSGAQR